MNQPLFVWAKKSWINVGVQIGHRQAKTTRVPTQEQRLAWLKELLTATPNPFPAGSPAPCCCFTPNHWCASQPYKRRWYCAPRLIGVEKVRTTVEKSEGCLEFSPNKAVVPIGCPLVPNSLSDGLRRVA